jgi:hypothetical protein
MPGDAAMTGLQPRALALIAICALTGVPACAQTRAVDLQANPLDYIQVPCKIEGLTRDLRCVIDTAALQTSVSDHLLRPEKGDDRIQIFGATGETTVPTRKVIFSVGGQKFRGFCLLLKVDVRQQFDVLLGRDFLGLFGKVTIDFANRKLILEAPIPGQSPAGSTR